MDFNNIPIQKLEITTIQPSRTQVSHSGKRFSQTNSLQKWMFKIDYANLSDAETKILWAKIVSSKGRAKPFEYIPPVEGNPIPINNSDLPPPIPTRTIKLSGFIPVGTTITFPDASVPAPPIVLKVIEANSKNNEITLSDDVPRCYEFNTKVTYDVTVSGRVSVGDTKIVLEGYVSAGTVLVVDNPDSLVDYRHTVTGVNSDNSEIIVSPPMEVALENDSTVTFEVETLPGTRVNLSGFIPVGTSITFGRTDEPPAPRPKPYIITASNKDANSVSISPRLAENLSDGEEVFYQENVFGSIAAGSTTLTVSGIVTVGAELRFSEDTTNTVHTVRAFNDAQNEITITPGLAEDLTGISKVFFKLNIVGATSSAVIQSQESINRCLSPVITDAARVGSPRDAGQFANIPVDRNIDRLEIGTYIRFSNHSKVYLIIGINSQQITIEPPLLKDIEENTTITYTNTPFTVALDTDSSKIVFNPPFLGSATISMSEVIS